MLRVGSRGKEKSHPSRKKRGEGGAPGVPAAPFVMSLRFSYVVHERIGVVAETVANPILEAGDTLDHYRLDAAMARSGMGTLFRATDLRNGRTVALKIPHAETETDPVLLERFRREEEIGRELDHPGIVKTFAGEERSRLYMVLEWVNGRLLRAVLNEERKLPVGRAVALTLQICDALDTMHKHGVVHRDLKPENIMVGGGDRVTIIDFGIAMKEDARRITHVGLTPALGTPDYISPEQVKGARGDERSDIYSMGAMLYEMLTGQPPFTGANPLAVMNERLLHDPAPARELNPAISPQIEEVLRRALERDPRHRYATASEMAWELEHPELVGVEENGARLRSRGFVFNTRKMLLYAGLALVPIVLFVIMLIVAKR
jgi:eukaryotic-like serine/threonine-protein kinase